MDLKIFWKHKFVWIIIILGILVYSNALFNDFVWDDVKQIVESPSLHTIKNIPLFFIGNAQVYKQANPLNLLYYRPISFTVLDLIYNIFHTPFFFHLFQISVHILNTILIFKLLKKFISNKISLLFSLLFLVHPINIEAVSYIASFQDVLFFLFGIAALNIVIKHEPQKYSIAWLFIFLLLSLLSKETGFLFIPLIIIYSVLFVRKKVALMVLPSAAPILIYLFLRFFISKSPINNAIVSPIMGLSFIDRLINIPAVFFFYIKTFLFPKDLAISQDWVVTKIDLTNFYFPLLVDIFFVVILLLIGYFCVKNNHKKLKTLLFFFSWFFLGIGFHLQIYPLDLTVAERYFYFPMAGLLGAIGVLIQYFIDKSLKFKKIWLYFIIVIILAFSLRTVIRNTDWQNPYTLYSHDIKFSRESFDLEANLGVELIKLGRLEEAKIHLENSEKTSPYHFENLSNLGVLYNREKNYKKAEEYFKFAIRENKDFYPAYHNLAYLYLNRGEYKTAEEFIKKALETYPESSGLWIFLSQAEYKLGNQKSARDAEIKAYSIK